jgi:23S rRNA G2069 N7-methylase RlmK/C1962 C5-methylase RlmI
MEFNFDFLISEEEQDLNTLVQYLQQQHPDTLARVAESASTELKEIISHNVQGLLGMLPSDDFQVQITTNRENLANLLASAMMTGYFLSQMEQRKNLDALLSGGDSLKGPSTGYSDWLDTTTH